MKLNILFWNTRDKIVFGEGDNNLCNVVGSNEESFYFVLNHEKIKTIFTECSNSEFGNNFFKGLYKKHEYVAIVLKEINKDNIFVITEIAKLKNVLIIAGKCDLQEKKDFKNLVYVPQLYYDKSVVDMYAIIYTIRSIYNNLAVNNSLKIPSIILGCEKEEEILGSIPLYILKNFNYISDCKDFILNIYGLKQLGIDQLIYIEDPLKEYMKENSKLIIKQVNEYVGMNKVYFILIAR